MQCNSRDVHPKPEHTAALKEKTCFACTEPQPNKDVRCNAMTKNKANTPGRNKSGMSKIKPLFKETEAIKFKIESIAARLILSVWDGYRLTNSLNPPGDSHKLISGQMIIFHGTFTGVASCFERGTLW